MLRNLLRKFVNDDTAQDLAEYGIALAVIGAGAAVAAIVIAGNVNTLWSVANSVIGGAAAAVGQ
jgi:Flp pilus assembly pilin Flp